MSGKANHIYLNTPLTYLVSKMGVTTLVAQPVSILRAKFCKIVMKCKIIPLIDLLKFSSFWPYFSKCAFEVATFFLAQYLSSQLSFISGSSSV